MNRLVAALLGPVAGIRGGRALLAIGLVDSVGTGLFLAGSAIFFTVVVGLSAGQVGIGLSVAGLLGIVAQPVIGGFADQWSPRRVLIALHLWRAAGFTAYVFTGDFVMFLVVAALLGIGEQAVSPVYQSYAEQVVGAEARVAMMARTRVVYNLGFAVGALLATVAIGAGTRTAFHAIMLGNAVTFLVAAVALSMAGALRTPSRAIDGAAGPRAAPLRLRALRDTRYMAVAAVNGVIVLHIALLGTAVPLWVTLHTSAPRALVGVLLVINTVLAVVFQVRASRGAESLDGGVRAMRYAGVALAACCAVFALTAGVRSAGLATGLLVLGLVLLTAGELWQSAGGWGLSFALAPMTSRTEYLAGFGLGNSAQFVLGPALVTIGVIENGAVGWLALAGCFLVATALVGPLVRRAVGRPQLDCEPALINSGS